MKEAVAVEDSKTIYGIAARSCVDAARCGPREGGITFTRGGVAGPHAPSTWATTHRHDDVRVGGARALARLAQCCINARA